MTFSETVRDFLTRRQRSIEQAQSWIDTARRETDVSKIDARLSDASIILRDVLSEIEDLLECPFD